MDEYTMAKKATRNYIILPACLLLLNAAEEVIIYKVQNYPEIAKNAYLLTFVLLLLFILGFSLVGDMLAPYIKTVFEGMHKRSHKHGGSMGIILFLRYLHASSFLYISGSTLWGRRWFCRQAGDKEFYQGKNIRVFLHLLCKHEKGKYIACSENKN
jgi:hypothetical protein